MFVDAIDHVRVGMPSGGEPLASWFYGEVLGLTRVPAPLADTVGGDCWFAAGAVRVHLVQDADFSPAVAAGPGFVVSDLGRFRARLQSAGVPVEHGSDAVGPFVRPRDPFGNQLEFRPGPGTSELEPYAAVIGELAGQIGGDEVGALVGFALELDRLRTVERQSFVAGGLRRENSAEHSWHVALLARACAPLAGPDVDVDRAVLLLLVHDVVEIDAGDVSIYDAGLDVPGHGAAASSARVEQEVAGADRLFGLLPPGVGAELRAAWDEYEAGDTPTARYARSFDRLAPFLLNLTAGGRPWARRGVTAADVRRVMTSVADGTPRLAAFVESMLDRAVDDGLLPRGGSGLILDTRLPDED